MNELVKEVAAKHGIAVGKNDPIMVLCTINQILLQKNAEEQEKLLGHFQEEVEAISHRWSEDTKAKAEKIINAALTTSRMEIQKGIQEGTKKAADTITKEVQNSASALAKQAALVAMLNVIGAGVALVAAAIVVWAIKF